MPVLAPEIEARFHGLKRIIGNTPLLAIDYARMDYRDAYLKDHPEIGDKRIFDGYILRSRTTYQFTRELFVRMKDAAGNVSTVHRAPARTSPNDS